MLRLPRLPLLDDDLEEGCGGGQGHQRQQHHGGEGPHHERIRRDVRTGTKRDELNCEEEEKTSLFVSRLEMREKTED